MVGGGVGFGTQREMPWDAGRKFGAKVVVKMVVGKRATIT